MSRKSISYGRWPSPLSVEDLFRASESLAFLRPGQQGLFFLLSLPEENNHQVLMHLGAQGQPRRVTPPGINVRSRVHEYGALPYAASDEAVYYCDYANQRLLRQPYDQLTQQAGEASPVTPSCAEGAPLLRYGDFRLDPQRRRLLAVREDHRTRGREPRNALVALDLATGGEGEVLFEGSDFVTSPQLSPDGRILAFQTWSHPNMPWDDTEIRVATFDREGGLAGLRQVEPERPGSLVQPQFSPTGDLYFLADWNGWWNLHRVKAADLPGGGPAEAVLPLAAECCPPQWVLGMRHYAFCGEGHLLLSINRRAFWEMALLNLASGELRVVAAPLGSLEDVFCHEGRALALTAGLRERACVTALALPETGSAARPAVAGDIAGTAYRPRSGTTLPEDSVSVPEHLSYRTQGAGEAFGLFYPPRNPRCRAPAGELPPLLVSVHGGPTSSARPAFNPAVQFWTSRGFAVFDVNHRGSTGYGRAFRRLLYGQWGVADIEDVIAGARHLAESGRVAPDKMVIRGASAGGYAVLSALAHGPLFRAGVSYYGISDLELLARDTHKFESRYLDQLIGPWPAAAEHYRARSPRRQVERIAAPVLLLQGTEDKVVPPNQAEEMYRLLCRKSPASRLILFPGEGHGFREPANQIKALQAELDFYQEILF